MAGGDVRTVDVSQIQLVATTLLPAVAEQMTQAETGLRNTRTAWEQPFAGLDIYREVGQAWGDVAVEFGRVLTESVERVGETAQHLVGIADRYAENEADNAQSLGDLFDVVPPRG